MTFAGSSLAKVARQLTGATIAAGVAGFPHTWGAITIGAGAAIALIDHALTIQKGLNPMNLDHLLNDFKTFLTTAYGDEQKVLEAVGAVETLAGHPAEATQAQPAPAPASAVSDPGLAAALAAAGATAPVEAPAEAPAPSAAPEPAPEAAPAAVSPVEAVVKGFDDLVAETLDALRLAPTPDQIQKLHDFAVHILKLVGVQL